MPQAPSPDPKPAMPKRPARSKRRSKSAEKEKEAEVEKPASPPPVKIYECEHGCGFSGERSVVEAHLTPTLNPNPNPSLLTLNP